MKEDMKPKRAALDTAIPFSLFFGTVIPLLVSLRAKPARELRVRTSHF